MLRMGVLWFRPSGSPTSKLVALLRDAVYDLGFGGFASSLRPCGLEGRYASSDAVCNLGFGFFGSRLRLWELEGARFAY